VERRTFIGAVAVGAFASVPRIVSAQQAAARRIGILSAGTLPRIIPTSFRDALRERGWVEGQNLIIERRSGDGYAERVPGGTGTDESRCHPELRCRRGRCIKERYHDDPEGNITGLSQIAPELAAKRLELIRELLPKATLIGELVDPANTYWQRVRPDYEQAFRAMRMHPLFVEVHNPGEIEEAIAHIGSRRADALVVRGDPMFTSNREQIARFAVRYALPTIAEEQRLVEAGILMSYGANPSGVDGIIVTYVDRILRGAKAGDLPIAQPTKFDLAINGKTAKALGLTIPQSLLLRADEVIQ